MNEKQALWVEAYIESGDAIKATKLVYTDVQEQSVATKTSYLKSTLANEIDNHAREQYKLDAPLMMSIIKDIAINSKQDSMRHKSADTWLSRAGHDAAIVTEHKETVTHEILIDRLKIAMTGLPKELISQVLPKELLNQMESKDEKHKQEPIKH